MNNYDSIERFISYFYQINFALKTKAQKVLEIGIGNKTVSDYLKRCGLSVTTCDFDRSLEPDVIADIRDLPFEKNQFETVLAFEVLEHIPFADFERSLRELARVSNKNIILSIPYSCAYFEAIFDFSIPYFKKTISIPIRIPYFPFGVHISKKTRSIIGKWVGEDIQKIKSEKY